jgi:hypothetical protein
MHHYDQGRPKASIAFDGVKNEEDESQPTAPRARYILTTTMHMDM